jgi:hypothetical protein
MGCLEKKPKEPTQTFISLSSEMINSSLSAAESWLYQQAENRNESYLINSTNDPSFLTTYEEFYLLLLISTLSQTNTSFLELHEETLQTLLSMIDANKSNSFDMNSFLRSVLILQILLKSPYFEAYEEQAGTLCSQLIEAYPYTDVFSSYQQGEGLLTYHFNMAELSLCLLSYFERTQNITSYQYAEWILQNTTTLQENLTTSQLYLISSSFYLPSYEMIQSMGNISTYDQHMSLTTEELIAKQDKSIEHLGSYQNITKQSSVFPDVFLEVVLSDAMVTSLSAAIKSGHSTNITKRLLISSVLSCYHLIQLQLDFSDSIKDNGSFPGNSSEMIPSILSTVRAYVFLNHVRLILADHEPYLYVYHMGSDVLYESHPEVREESIALWVALAIGTICSIICLGVVYLIVTLKRRFK